MAAVASKPGGFADADAAVMKLYGYPRGAAEPEIVADLMGRYVGLTSGKQ